MSNTKKSFLLVGTPRTPLRLAQTLTNTPLAADVCTSDETAVTDFTTKSSAAFELSGNYLEIRPFALATSGGNAKSIFELYLYPHEGAGWKGGRFEVTWTSTLYANNPFTVTVAATSFCAVDGWDYTTGTLFCQGTPSENTNTNSVEAPLRLDCFGARFAEFRVVDVNSTDTATVNGVYMGYREF